MRNTPPPTEPPMITALWLLLLVDSSPVTGFAIPGSVDPVGVVVSVGAAVEFVIIVVVGVSFPLGTKSDVHRVKLMLYKIGVSDNGTGVAPLSHDIPIN
ncbi:hypothetical protein F5H01DRAFT_137982 [Linnemannia elongata]|nr:hypothetical protein F5H01DRAFT_137982 [Linnemannia elongata]